MAAIHFLNSSLEQKNLKIQIWSFLDQYTLKTPRNFLQPYTSLTFLGQIKWFMLSSFLRIE
jgi:hypothetical protein